MLSLGQLTTELQRGLPKQTGSALTLRIVAIPFSIHIGVLEETVRSVIKKIGVKIEKRDVQACQKEKERTIVNFVNKKDCLQVLRVKKELKFLDSTELDFPESTKIFINEILCPYYRSIRNKCKKLRAIQKIYYFYTISGLIRVKLEKTGPLKIITGMVDLKESFQIQILKICQYFMDFLVKNFKLLF